MSNKQKTVFSCQSCGAEFPKWAGQCVDCKAWNCIVEAPKVILASKPSLRGYADQQSEVVGLDQVNTQAVHRVSTQITELDRVLGGGLTYGSVVLIGGDPGIGKSTLLLQTICHLSESMKAIYITGEESLSQIAMRAKRLTLSNNTLQLLAETQVEQIISKAKIHQPKVMVIDSIQTIYTSELNAAPGSVSQVREATAHLVRYAKQTNTALFIVGHVTKEGALAGPRVLEHMVDTVLYFEGQTDNRFRVIRAVKNRFGAANELGVFAMTEVGLKAVSNPSAIFLSQHSQEIAGSCVMVTQEGSRPLLCEVQALVDESHLANPRRVAVGMEHNRMAMLLAILHRHAGIATFNQDVFINVVGGIKVSETAIDLALLLAVVSSLKNKPLPQGFVAFGEVGLSGEIRPVPDGEARLKAAHKHGFKQVMLPHANRSKLKLDEMVVTPVASLSAVFSQVFR